MDRPAQPQPDPPVTPPATPSRRTFIRGLGIAAVGAAGIGVGGLAVNRWLTPSPAPSYPAPTARPEQAFDHLVVVMFENRSFDN